MSWNNDDLLPGLFLPQFESLREELHINEDRNKHHTWWKFYVPERYSARFLYPPDKVHQRYRPSFTHTDQQTVETVRDICASCLACWLNDDHSYDAVHLELLQRKKSTQKTGKRSPALDAFIAKLEHN